MLELIRAGGWPMIPLLLMSAVALGFFVERFWSLRPTRVLPPGLVLLEGPIAEILQISRAPVQRANPPISWCCCAMPTATAPPKCGRC